jgi:uncharacterized linocin/CFP29 family protein
MDLMRQQLAPISDAAWDEINDEAKNVFALGLSGRRMADVSGPLGIDTAAVNLGRLEIPKKQGKDKQGNSLRYGVRRVLPLVEVRAPFELDIWELDNVDRGARDPDLDDLRRAAREVAKFEERAVYDGFPDASIDGLLGASEFEPIEVATEPGSLLDGVAKAVMRLRYADVEGPYALALGAALYQWLDSGSERGYPLRKRMLQTIEGPIIPAPYLHGGVVMSQRGGDAELTLGQDIAIGYESHDQRTVRLYFSESFTFRVLAPEAIVALGTAASK